MKKLYILFLLITSIGFAQIPANYYDGITTETGYTLKTALRDIVTNGHTSRTYDQLYDGVGINGSQGYVDTHSDNVTESGYENDGSVLDMYSENPAGSDPYNYNHGLLQCGNQSAEGDCYNREHLVPQSSFNSNFPMQSDIHHVIPTDGRVNNFRGSLAFGDVDVENWTSLNGSKRGSSAVPGYSGTVFEPIDEFKGDIARALLYFATRYENTVDGYTSFVMFNGTNNQVFQTWAIDMLLDWHNNVDPVDQRERDRNDETYNFQGNANPFVDHPEYADLIWNPTPDTENPTDPTNLIASNPTDNTVDLTWTVSTDNIGVTSYDVYVDGFNDFNTSNTSFTVTGLTANTMYCFTIKAKDAAGNESGFSNQDCETTTNNGSGGISDLFFSEYIEGSSNNKVLEIANFTGISVDLSIYTLKLSANGNASWGGPYSFPMSTSIANQDVYVIANGSSTLCTSENDDLNNAITSFNGNDAIGLFKNDVLIDILGDFNSSADYAIDVTLVRKPTIEFPTTIFDINEWNSFAQNNCDDLGSHNQTLSSESYSVNTIKIYPNPVKNNVVYFSFVEDLNVVIYDVLGKQVLIEKVNSTKDFINVSSLNKGIYLVKINSSQGTSTKKLIKQ